VFRSNPAPEIQSETEVYCNNCSWHGDLKTLKTP
jgi:hypothetical protein